MPFIKLCYLEEGKLIVRVNCKCGKLFHDISTFVSEYTDIETQLETEKNYDNTAKLVFYKFHENCHSKYNCKINKDKFAPRYLYDYNLNELDTYYDLIIQYKYGKKS